MIYNAGSTEVCMKKTKRTMIEVMADAKKRREKYYAEWLRTEPKLGLVAKMAKKHKLSATRMSQLLALARPS